MPKTEGWTLRAEADLVAYAASRTRERLNLPRIDRGQLARAGLYALALGYLTDDQLAECVHEAERRGGWPSRLEPGGPTNPEPDRRAWVTRASGPDYAGPSR